MDEKNYRSDGGQLQHTINAGNKVFTKGGTVDAARCKSKVQVLLSYENNAR